MPYNKHCEKSPFPVPVSTVRKKYVPEHLRVLLTVDTGEANDIVTRKMITYDPTRFTKVYDAAHIIFLKLGTPGIRMMYYLMENMPVCKDYLYIDVNEAAKLLGYGSKRTVYLGIKDLVKNNVLAYGKRDSEYWINTMMFFNGKRREFK